MHIEKKESITCHPHAPERLRVALSRYGYLIPNNIKLNALQFSELVKTKLPSDTKAIETTNQLEDLWNLYQNGLSHSESELACLEGWCVNSSEGQFDFNAIGDNPDKKYAYRVIKKGLINQSSLHLKAYNLARVFNPCVAIMIAKTSSK